MMAHGDLEGRVLETGTDPSGLGRWCWFLCKGRDNVQTRIITACQPCRSSGAHHSGSCHRQQLWHFRKQSNAQPACPRRAFVRDFGAELRRWRNEGERLLAMMDANEDVHDSSKPIARMFEDLGMKDTTCSRHPKLKGTPTFHKGDQHGSKQIDTASTTPEIYANSAAWLSVHKSPGDHLATIFDTRWRVLLGKDILQTVKPAGR